MNPVIKHLNDVQMALMQPEKESVASLFHEQSKIQPHVQFIPPTSFDPALLPEISQRAFKEYRLAPQIALPEPRPLPGSLDSLILKRRTVRDFTNRAVMLEEMATQLALSYRILKSDSFKRPVPSGGAMYPLELYVSSVNVAGLDEGLYHYHPAHHALEILSTERPWPALQHGVVHGNLAPDTAYVFFICGILPRNRFKYGERGYRLMLLEAGHLAQNILLVAEAQGLGGFPVCGFYDDRLHDYLEVDGIDEVCLYLLLLGHPNDKSD